LPASDNSSKESPALDLSSYRQALALPEDGLGVVQDGAWFSRQSEKLRHTLIAGLIQNFQFVYEISTKMLRRLEQAHD